MAEVNTVGGRIGTGELGFTLMHEHVVLESPAVMSNWPEAFDRTRALDLCVEKLAEAKAAGVDTIVDQTTADNGRDVPLLLEIADRSEVNVIVATGIWLFVPRFFRMRSPQEVSRYLVRDIESGIQGTTVRAGIIKTATEGETVGGLQELSLRACARAHRETGVPLATHSDAAVRGGLDQQRILTEEGVDLSRVIIGHSGDSEDLSYLKRLLSEGSYLGMDRFGLTHIHGQRFLTTKERVGVVAALCREGFSRQIFLSHDTSPFPDGRTVEYQERTWPDWRWTHVPENVIPALRERGVSEEQVDDMTRRNARAFFERQEAY